MVKVDNREALWGLTVRFMAVNRRRNGIALSAIVLTCLLFTTLFTGTGSLILTKRQADVKAFRVSAHSFIQDLTKEEYQKALRAVKESRDVAEYGSGIFLGGSLDRRFGFSAEVRYGDQKTAESFSSMPTTGRLPREEDEIAVGTIVLDALGLPHELGTEVTLSYEQEPSAHGIRTETFRLSGYWESDRAVMGQMLWVSQAYARKNCHRLTREELESGVLNGGYDLDVWYDNLLFLSKKTEKLSKAAGFLAEGTGFEVNPAYDLMEEDGFSFGTVLVMALLILLAGYLIIYNIFSISVRADLRVYGLLKNIGMTAKQLKKIVYMQAVSLAAVGIPAGLLGGFLAGRAMAPLLNADLEEAAEGEALATVVSADLWIFVAAAAFTFVTIYLSLVQPCRLVSRVSPVEALRLAEDENTYRKSRKKAGAGGWPAMAVQNVSRNLPKGCMVMFSIALSLVVMDCIVMLVQGYDLEAYKKIILGADFQLSQAPATLDNAKLDGITPAIQAQLEQCPCGGPPGYVYYQKGSLEMPPGLKEKWKEWGGLWGESWSSYEKEVWQQIYEEGRLPVHYMGINETAFRKLEWNGKACTWESFEKGGQALIGYDPGHRVHPFSYHRTGDEIRVELKGKGGAACVVGGMADLPYPMDYPYADPFAMTVIVPEESFILHTGVEGAMCATIDCGQEERKAVKKYLEDTVLKENSLINIASSLDLDASFQRFLGKYTVIGGVMASVLGVIGVLNFFNAVAASVISRKRELALLEAVGMEKSQIVKMLCMEGCIYLAGAEAMALGMVCVCAEGLLERTLGRAFFFRFHLAVWPCLAPVPVLFLIVYGISRWQFRKMSRESVVERLRE